MTEQDERDSLLDPRTEEPTPLTDAQKALYREILTAGTAGWTRRPITEEERARGVVRAETAKAI